MATRLLLLVTFVAGGVLAPALHRVQHGFEGRDIGQQARLHEQAVSGTAAETIGDSIPDKWQEPVCLLCKVAPDQLIVEQSAHIRHTPEPFFVDAAPSLVTSDKQWSRGRSPPSMNA